jgi:hypothetical protein
MKETINPDTTSVYKYFDAGGALIYVGITNQGPARQKAHVRAAVWWSLAVRSEIEHFGTRAAAAKRESELIREHRPKFNVAGNPDRPPRARCTKKQMLFEELVKQKMQEQERSEAQSERARQRYYEWKAKKDELDRQVFLEAQRRRQQAKEEARAKVDEKFEGWGQIADFYRNFFARHSTKIPSTGSDSENNRTGQGELDGDRHG